MSTHKASIKDKGVDILFGNGLPSVEGPRASATVGEGRGGRSETRVPYGEMPAIPSGPGVAKEGEEEAVPSAALELEEEEQAVSRLFSETRVPYGEVPTVPPGPGVAEAEEIEEEAVPSADLEREEDEQVVMKRVGRNRRNQLFREIDDLYERVGTELSGNTVAPKATTALKRLRKARDILMESPRQFDEAEYQIGQVRLLLARTAQSHEWARHYGTRLFVYEVVWFLLLTAGVISGIIFSNQLARGLVLATGMTPEQVEDLLVSLISTMMWGGIGGVLGALYSLRWHISMRDFDREYNIWYIANPFMGIVLGGIVYLIFRAGFLVVSDITGATKWLPPVVACLAGFREKFALELLDRLIQVIARGPETPVEEEEVELERPSAPVPSPPSS